MSVLTIRAHKRFAVRREVRLRDASGKQATGLMIELCSEGCRISQVDGSNFDQMQDIILEIGSQAHTGIVRWARDRLVGLKLDKALHLSEMAEIIGLDRAAHEAAEPQVRYGT